MIAASVQKLKWGVTLDLHPTVSASSSRKSYRRHSVLRSREILILMMVLEVIRGMETRRLHGNASESKTGHCQLVQSKRLRRNSNGRIGEVTSR
jgi:hypothetical protein